jgi:NAD(P)H-flavin reductase/hemoglobin-like flavoprotein
VSALSPLLRESWSHVRDASDDLASYLFARLFLAEPSLRDMFPVDMASQRARLVGALAIMIETIDDQDRFEQIMRDLGRHHVKFHVQPEHFAMFETALLDALRNVAGDHWSHQYDQAWHDAYARMSRAMMRGTDEFAGHPAFWHAEITSHERRASDIAMFTCQPLIDYPYQAGQYASIETTHVPREWRPLWIGNPPGTGPLEFHVRAASGGWVSSVLVRRLRVGDVVRLGPAMGTMTLDPLSTRDIVCIAGGTGVAPIKALIGELAEYNRSRWVHVFFGAKTRADLYDLPALQRLAARYSWLSVVPACTDDPTFAGERGNVSDVMERLGPYPDHDFFVCGPPEMMGATLRALRRMEVPASRIRYDAGGVAPNDG